MITDYTGEKRPYDERLLIRFIYNAESSQVLGMVHQLKPFAGGAIIKFISDKEVLQYLGDKQVQEEMEKAPFLQKGDKVKVITGQFQNHIGEIEAVKADSDQVLVNILIYGRVTPVSINIYEVEKT